MGAPGQSARRLGPNAPVLSWRGLWRGLSVCRAETRLGAWAGCAKDEDRDKSRPGRHECLRHRVAACKESPPAASTKSPRLNTRPVSDPSSTAPWLEICCVPARAETRLGAWAGCAKDEDRDKSRSSSFAH